MPESQINPGLLSAQNLVNANAQAMPLSAVQALSDAMRTGALTAQDIMDRTGELGKTARKAKILSLKQEINELSDPELSAAKHAIQLAGGDTARLQSAQAQAALPNVAPAAELTAEQIAQQRKAIEDAAQMAKFPAAGFFDKAAPLYGLETPMTADGKVDWVRKAKIGAQIALHDVEKKEAEGKLEAAKAERANITTQLSADGGILSAVTKQGRPVTPERVVELDTEIRNLFRQSTAPFQQVAPGTATVAPATIAQAAPVAPVVVPKATPEQRAQLVSIGVSPTDAAAMDDKTVALMLSPNTATTQAQVATPAPVSVVPIAAAAPAATGVGSVIPGVGMSLGTKPTPEKAPTEAQQRAQLALARFAQSNDIMASLQSAGYRPESIGSWMSSLLPEMLKSGDRKTYEAAVNAWSQGLLRLESGAAISRQEATWYNKAFFPQVGDPPSLVTQKEALRHDAERMVAEIAQAGHVDSPESVSQTKRLYERANSLASQQSSKGGEGPVITLSTGRKVRRDANGNYFDAQ